MGSDVLSTSLCFPLVLLWQTTQAMANPDRLLDRLERERRAGYAFDFAGAMFAAQRGFERRTPFEAAPAVREAPRVEF